MTRTSFPLIVTWSDLCFVWNKYRRLLLRVAALCAVAGAFFTLLIPPRYTAKALLREGGSSASLGSSSMSNLFNSIVTPSSDGNSLVLLQSDSVLRLAVQNLGLQIVPDSSGSSFPGIGVFKRLYEGALIQSRKEAHSQQPFIFSDVVFEGDEPIGFSLVFHDEKTFSVQDRDGLFLIKGALAQKISIPGATFSVRKAPSDIIGKNTCSFTILPWQAAVGSLRSRLEIRPEKLDKSLLRLFYSSNNREQAVRILDGIMGAYLQYLQDEHTRLADKQIAFLSEHQDQFTEKLDKELDEYLCCLKKNIDEWGFFEVEQEVKVYVKRQEELKKKLIDLDRLFNRLQKAQTSYASATRREAEKESKSSSILPAHNMTPLLASKQPQNRVEQFAGIDLDTAEKLHAEYQKEVDICQEHIDKLSFLLSRIHQKDFDLNALGALVNDSVTSNLISRASELYLQGKDTVNRSQKDLSRIDDSLAAQKTFIAQHLGQSLELYEQNSLIAQGKLERLRDVMMKLVETEKAGIHAKLHEIRCVLSELPERWKLEKQLVFKEDVMGKLITGISQMIEGKTIEHRLKQLSSKIIDPSFAPAKPKIASFPLLMAGFAGIGVALMYMFFFCRLLVRGFPLSEATARALNLSTSGTVGSNCDVPLEDLKARDAKTIRSLANFIQEKKKAEQGVLILLTGAKRPNFLHNLAKFLSMRDERVLIIDATFDFAVSADEEGSLWAYLSEKCSAWHVQKRESFDTLPCGSTGRFCNELLHKQRFTDLLTKVRLEYDVVLLVSSGLMNEMKSKIDAHILTLQEESIEELEQAGLADQFQQSAASTIVFQGTL